MIKRLRKKFVLINMGLVAGVLLIVFFAVAVTVVRQSERSVNEALNATVNIRLEDPPTVPEIVKRRDGAHQAALRASTLPSFCVQLDQSGQITDFMQQNATVSSEVMQDVATQAAASGKSTGLLREYELRYSIRYSSAGLKIAFVDVSLERQKTLRQLLTLLIAGIAGLAAFFGVSLFLSVWALRPAEQAWERQRQFVADASHELKTPITVVLANTDIMLSHPEESVEQQKKWLVSTQDESLRMKTLVDDMLFLARADTAAPPQMERFSLSDAVWSATLPFEALAYEAGVRLDTEIASGVECIGNEQQIRQLTGILLDNAVKYAGKGGAVSARLTAMDGRIALAVTNTGEPIDQEKLPHLFERFYRADAARDRTVGGYGLGLAIAQSIAEMHHANILVTSNALSGTTFTVEWREQTHGRQG